MIFVIILLSSDTILSVVLGNLLENALDACVTDTRDEKQIVIKSFYLSSKHSGRGLGLPSVRYLVEEYDGRIEITPEKERFCVSVLLMIDEEMFE